MPKKSTKKHKKSSKDKLEIENEEIRKIGNCFNCGKEIYSNMGYVYGTDDLFCGVKCEFDYLRKNKKL